MRVRKLHGILGLPFGMVLSVGLAGAAAAQCMIYEDRNYRGESRVIEANRTVADLGRAWRNRTSAVRVTRGCQLVTHENPNFEGDRRTFRQSAAWVERYWDDRVSSASCVCPEMVVDPIPSPGPQPASACRLYSEPNFRGGAISIGENRQRRSLGNLTNRVSSLSVPRGCRMQVFTEPGYRGDDRTFRAGERARLSRRFEDTIASARCACELDPDPAPVPTPAACTLHAFEDFRGVRLSMDDGDRRRLTGNQLRGTGQSLTLEPGCTITFRGRTGATRTVRSSQRRLTREIQTAAVSADCSCSAFQTERDDGRQSSEPDPFGDDGDRFDDEPRGALRRPDNRADDLLRPNRPSVDDDLSGDRGGFGEDRDIVETNSCTLFRDRGFEGASVTLRGGTGIVSMGRRLDNSISSVRVANGCSLTVFDEDNYRGASDVFRRDEARITGRLSDATSSAQCRCRAAAAPERSARDAEPNGFDEGRGFGEDDVGFDDQQPDFSSLTPRYRSVRPVRLIRDRSTIRQPLELWPRLVMEPTRR